MWLFCQSGHAVPTIFYNTTVSFHRFSMFPASFLGFPKNPTFDRTGNYAWIIFQHLLDTKNIKRIQGTSLHWSLTQFTPASMEVGHLSETRRDGGFLWKLLKRVFCFARKKQRSLKQQQMRKGDYVVVEVDGEHPPEKKHFRIVVETCFCRGTQGYVPFFVKPSRR